MAAAAAATDACCVAAVEASKAFVRAAISVTEAPSWTVRSEVTAG